MRYYADDLKYEIAPVAVEEDFEIGKNIVENGEFDENKTGWSTNGKMTIVNDPADPAPDGSAGYLKMEPASADKPYWNQIGQKMTWQANHLYKVSYYMKFDGPLKEGTTDTAAVYSGDSNSTTYNLIEVKTGGGWLYQGANGTNRVSDTNSYNANYPGYVKKQAVSVGNGWSKIEYYYVHEFKTFTDKPIGTNLRLFAGDNQNLMSSGVFGLDSFKIIDMGPISNGDFEIGQASVIKFPKSVTQNVLGWTESSATSAQAAEARPGSEGTSSMKVTLTANGGYVYQGLSMTPSRSYKISFWAKGNDLDSEVPFALVMDRKVPASGGESESYTVPDYEYITGKNEICTDYTDDVKASQSWKLSNEWTYYECYYDNEFPLLDGLTKAVDYTFPRLPFMYFNVNGNASGTSYSLDDVQIECIGAVGAVTPVITNAAVTGKLIPGEKVGVSYNYSHPTDGTDDSIVRMLCETDNGQYASLGSFKASEQITVPETAIGKNIVFEILPVDGNANCGITVRAEASDPGSWAKIYVDAETLAVRAYASENKTAKVIYAAYNGKELISVGFADVNLTANTRGDVTIPAEFTSNGADTVKVMLWEGIENVIPLCTNETLSLN